MSNDNALHVSVMRSMAKDMTSVINYVWSKTLGTDTDFQYAGNPVAHRQADYGLLTYDRTQTLVVNYIYNLPKFAKDGTALANPAFKLILNDWQISGITSLTSGAPQVVGQSVAHSDAGKYSVQGV